MNREETKRIIRIMADCYPNYNPADVSETVDVWTMMLEEYSYEQVSIALKSHVISDTSGFAPSIGQLVSKIQMLTQKEELNEMEAWHLVSKAIKNGYYGAEEEFSKLPELVQKSIGSHEQLRQWAQSDLATVESVIQSNFMRTYRVVVERHLNVSKMPVEARKRIEAINYRPMLENRNLSLLECSCEDAENVETVPMPEWAKEKLKKCLEG